MQSLTVKLRDEWKDATLRDAGWLLGFAALFWASKWAGKSIDGVPGHSGMFWIPALFLARCVVARPGAATATAMLGAVLWCFPKGGGAGALAPFVMAGLVLDGLRRDRLRSFPFAVAAGALCHLAKFGFHNVPAALLGVPRDFMILGVWTVAGLHLAFGAAGGLLGWLVAMPLGRTGATPASPGRW